MDRRDALMSLLLIPGLRHVSAIEAVRPGDVVIVTVADSVGSDVFEQVANRVRLVWPEPTRIVVVQEGLKFDVYRRLMFDEG